MRFLGFCALWGRKDVGLARAHRARASSIATRPNQSLVFPSVGRGDRSRRICGCFSFEGASTLPSGMIHAMYDGSYFTYIAD